MGWNEADVARQNANRLVISRLFPFHLDGIELHKHGGIQQVNVFDIKRRDGVALHHESSPIGIRAGQERPPRNRGPAFPRLPIKQKYSFRSLHSDIDGSGLKTQEQLNRAAPLKTPS
jgi:hypothetical protein